MQKTELARESVAFWFGDLSSEGSSTQTQRWFTKDVAFDGEILERFGPVLERAKTGELDSWGSEPRQALALVILVDKLARNAYRGTAEAFAQDPRGLRVCLDGQARGLDRALTFLQRYVFVMPMMHSEDREIQRRGVLAFHALSDEAKAASEPETVQAMLRSAHEYAGRHAAIIERFGRFPHRNAILGRASTDEEVAFLAQPGSSF